MQKNKGNPVMTKTQIKDIQFIKATIKDAMHTSEKICQGFAPGTLSRVRWSGVVLSLCTLSLEVEILCKAPGSHESLQAEAV